MAPSHSNYSDQEVKEAQAVINKCRTKNGAIEPGAVEYLRENYPDSLEAIENNRRKVGRLTQLLSKNLYSKNTRFIFELIQNADDNQYTQAGQRNELPWVSLTLTPDQFILDCNEDGFTAKNVNAVCTVAESTKAAEKTQGYIGEKGIGFKSVFRIFRSAHIQSGPFAFSFSYDPDKGDEAGLDLVTPIAETLAELPPKVKTRIILSLPYGSDFDGIRQDLKDVPDTMLLFLNRIRQLEIHIKPTAQFTSSAIYTRRELRTEHTTIEQEWISFGTREKIVKNYLIERRAAKNLPRHETRQNIHSADVLLAFPLDERCNPLFDDQYIHAYLPLRKAGFNFLIQSDFITNASRELLDDGCARNNTLLKEVAQAFQSAMLRFASDDGPNALQYTWMGYLPETHTANDPFWKQLRPEILRLLQESNVVRSWSGTLSLASSKAHLPQHMLDADGQPLLPDNQPESYLSPKYSSMALSQLRALGVHSFSPQNFVQRLGVWVGSFFWKLRTLPFDHSWHTKFWRCLNNILDKSPSLRNQLREMPLVLLQSKDWVATSRADCYWPKVQNITVPGQIGLSLVDQAALNSNSDFGNVLLRLGVTECSASFVISRIQATWQSNPGSMLITNLINQQFFLFKFASERANVTIPVCDDKFKRRDKNPMRRNGHIYFKDDHDSLAVAELLGTESQCYKENRFFFLCPSYLTSYSETATNAKGQTWKSWLEEVCGIRPIMQLLSPDEFGMSPEFYFLLEQQQQTALSLMSKYWPNYQTHSDKLKGVLARWLMRTESNGLGRLSELYIALPKLKQVAKRVGVDGRFFLQMPENFKDNDDCWQFLKHFGVRFAPDYDFYLGVLETAARACASRAQPNHILATYQALSGFVASDADAKEKFRLKANDSLIYIPADSSHQTPAKWASANECCWKGQELLTVVRRLGETPMYKDERACEIIFKDTWGVRDACSATYADELASMKANNAHDPEKISKIYQEFVVLRNNFTKSKIKARIEAESLVYVHNDRVWVSPQQCAWIESRIRLDSCYGIADLYQHSTDLKGFFCNMLRIQEPNIEMFVNTLEQDALKGRSFNELKQHMLHISRLGPSITDLERLKSVAMFSVRHLDGIERLVTSESDFAIVDREDYRSLFGNRMTTLSMTLQEIQHRKGFLAAFGLEDRFCSKTAVSKTQVGEHSPNADLTHSMRGFTEPFLRCMSFYNESADMSQFEALAQKLQNMHVFLSDEISNFVEIRQGERTIRSEKQHATFHLSDDEESLQLYVPEQDSDREQCFLHDLPKGLLKQMGITDLAAEPIIITIVNARFPATITAKLAQAGIPQLPEELKTLIKPVPPPANVPAVSIEQDISPETGLADRLNAVHISPPRSREVSREASRGRSVTPPSPMSVFSTTTHWARRTVPPSQDVAPILRPTTPSPDRRAQFAGILDRVIKQASGLGPTAASSSLTFGQVFSWGDPNRDFHVGVAGEVYLLNKLQVNDIPSFDVEHWRSSIRNLAEAHVKYINIGRSTEPETADFVYTDTTGSLTQHLKDEGALAADANLCETIEYHIEVKTTTGGCNDKFYMSQSQVDFMESLAMKPGVPASKLYVIARVFNIDGPDIGLKFYVDPHRLRHIIRPFHEVDGSNDDTLRFSSTDKWAVQAR